MQRIYLSGPMTGRKDFNYPVFNAEAARVAHLATQSRILPSPNHSRARVGALHTCCDSPGADLRRCGVPARLARLASVQRRQF